MFEMILFGLVLLSGSVLLACKYLLKTESVGAANTGSDPGLTSQYPAEPWYLDYARSFFPVLLIVFILRGLVAEPFRIPSGSMLPTLEVGDFILVNKFAYGLRLPILHNKFVETGSPKRGDIMVFRYPGDNKTNYIKRVIGLPGDLIEYRGQRVYVNGQMLKTKVDGDYSPLPLNGGRRRLIQRFTQTIISSTADTSITENVDFSILMENHSSSPNVKRVVPLNSYFVLGDNRDHSLDSRFWGFVPEKNVVGKAFFIWFHWNGYPGGGFNFSRVGESL